jgi:hypothetical protein
VKSLIQFVKNLFFGPLTNDKVAVCQPIKLPKLAPNWSPKAKLVVLLGILTYTPQSLESLVKQLNAKTKTKHKDAVLRTMLYTLRQYKLADKIDKRYVITNLGELHYARVSYPKKNKKLPVVGN